MTDKNDWRTRQDYPEDSFDDYSEDDDDYYDDKPSSYGKNTYDWRTRATSYDERSGYVRRDSYDRGDRRDSYDRRDSFDKRDTFNRDNYFFQHEEKEKTSKNKDKPRPSSSSTHRETDGDRSDNSTHSEPPYNRRKPSHYRPISNKKGDTSKSTTTSVAGKSAGVPSKSPDKISNKSQTSTSAPQEKGADNTQSKPTQKSDKTPTGKSVNIQVDRKQETPKKDLTPQKSLSTNPKKGPSNPTTTVKTPPSVSLPTNVAIDTSKQKTQSNTAAQRATDVEKQSVKAHSPPKKDPSNPATPVKTPSSVSLPTNVSTDTSKQKTQSNTAAQRATDVEKKAVKDEPGQKVLSPLIPQANSAQSHNTAKTPQSNEHTGHNTNLQDKTKISPKKEPSNPATSGKTPTSPPVIPVITQPIPISSSNSSSNTNPDIVTEVTKQKTSPKIENKNPQTRAVPPLAPQILHSAPTHPPPPIPPSNISTNKLETQSTTITEEVTNTSQVNKTNEPITYPTVPKDESGPINQSSIPKVTAKDTAPPTLLSLTSTNPLTQLTPTTHVNTDTNISSQSTNLFSITQSVEVNTGNKFPILPFASHHTLTPINLIPVDNKTEETNVINTLPSHKYTLPPQPDITSCTFKELVSTDTRLFDEDIMSDQPSTALLEKVNALSDNLEEEKQKVIKAELNEQNSKKEIQTLKEEKDRITKDLEQRKIDILTRDTEKNKALDDLQSHIQEVAKLSGEKTKINKELDTIKKECDNLKTQVEHNTSIKADIDKLIKEKQQLNSKLSDIDSNYKKLSKEIADKEKTVTKLKESHSADIKNLNSKMAQSKNAFAESQSEIKKVTDDRDAKLKQIDNELQTAKEARNRLETEKKNNIQEIKQLKEKIGEMERDTVGFKEYISQLEKETKQNEASMGSSVDIELISKIEKAFVDLSGLVPPPEYQPGSHERVEWLVASLVSWNADLNGKISINESYLHEKQTEIETMQGELQAIMNYLQHQMPTNSPSSAAINSTDPLNLVKSILAGKTEEMSKANDLIRKAETDKQKMEMQIQEISRHYNTEDSKNEQLMQDNAALERQIQTLISEKEELEVKNVELINELSELREGAENLNSPTTQSKLTNFGHVEGSFNPRPSPLYLETTSPFPFDTPMSPPPTALSSLTLGHKSTLQKAADELSHLKVKVWESEAENSKLREQLSAQARDPALTTNISPDAEGAFQAVFEANQVNLVKLAESTRDKEVLFKDIEFLRQRVEDLEKNAERLKVSIEVKEVAYKELYLECRDWERKYKKCSNVHHELERVKRQLLQKEADSQECATLRAERLNQQTTLDNLGAELLDRKKLEQSLKRNNQKLQTRLEECLRHISNMQTHLQEKPIMKPQTHSLPEPPLHYPPFPSQQEPRPVSPTILKPPSMSSAPLSPPTRQPPTATPFSKHPPILYPPTS